MGVLDGRRNGEAVARAFSVHRGALHAAATRILGCCDLAGDAVQEALITLWLDPPGHAEERAWLFRTVVHRSLHVRRTRLRRERWERLALEAALATPNLDPLTWGAPGVLEERETLALLEHALRALPAPYREVFLLRTLDGWAYERIANTLGVPVGTVRSRLNRARAALRMQLIAATKCCLAPR